MPPWIEWLANIDNAQTRRAYQIDVADLIAFLGIEGGAEFRQVTRAHVIAWRDELKRRGASPATIRRKLSAVASLFDYLCERNAVPENPANGVRRPAIEHPNEGKTPAISDDQARQLLDAPDPTTLKGKRDRAILAVFLYHGLRREELCRLTHGDLQPRRALPHHSVLDPILTTPLLRVFAASREIFSSILLHRSLLIPAPSPSSATSSNTTPAAPASTSEAFASTPFEQPRPQTPWSPKPTSRKCRSGSATRTSARRASMIGGGAGWRIRRLGG